MLSTNTIANFERGRYHWWQ